MSRTYLLSPARLDGLRAQLLFRPGASFPVAAALKNGGAPIGLVFAFLSGLYFRGKLAYAQRFAARARDVRVITTNRGLLPASSIVTLDDLRRFAETDIHQGEPAFRDPLVRDAKKLRGEIVLLGSVASSKYVEVLLQLAGERLLFPSDFVGRGDMSRGGLLLRAAQDGKELPYAPVRGAVLHGRRPPKLSPRPTDPRPVTSG
jgi:hypothetical protein